MTDNGVVKRLVDPTRAKILLRSIQIQIQIQKRRYADNVILGYTRFLSKMSVDCRFAVLARVPIGLVQGTGYQPPPLDSPLSIGGERGDVDNVEVSASKDAVGQLRGADLVIALSLEHLVVFARTLKSLSCSCRHGPRNELLAAGFHCPHIVGLADHCCVAAIPIQAISQVLITYKTQQPTTPSATAYPTASGSGVAARTKELVLTLRYGGHFWLEFEHNLARGMFLDALTTSATAMATTSEVESIDVDYVDISEAISSFSVAASELGLVAFPASSLKTTDLAVLLTEDPVGYTGDVRFAFVRDALRHVVYDKVHLALQISRDLASEFEDCATRLLLSTAMTLSQTLDEPDLVAFAWLARAAITSCGEGATKADSSRLALTQAMCTVDIARENSFPYLRSLGLHCAADLQRVGGSATIAKDYLVEAARLTPDGVEAGLKMQLHRKIHELRDRVQEVQTRGLFTATKSTRAGLDAVSTAAVPKGVGMDPSSKQSPSGIQQQLRNSFSLWDHSVSARFKELLLHKVLKLPTRADTPPVQSADTSIHALRTDKRAASCYVEIMLEQQSEWTQPNRGFGVDTVVQSPRTRLRVFFDCLETVEWLRCEVARRLRSTGCSAINSRDSVSITAFWELGPDHRRWQRIEWGWRLGDIVMSDDQVLVATLGSVPPSDVTATPIVQHQQQQQQQHPHPEKHRAPIGSASDQPQEAMLTCSVCHAQVSIEDAETHSDACS